MKIMIQPDPKKLPNWWVPKLHEGLAPRSANYEEMRQWCEENCTEPFYMYPSWMRNMKGAQFEDNEDARNFNVWAMLRWA